MIAIQKRHCRTGLLFLLCLCLLFSSFFITFEPIDADALNDYAPFSLSEDVLSSAFQVEVPSEAFTEVESDSLLTDAAVLKAPSETASAISVEPTVFLDVLEDDLADVKEILAEIARKEAEEAARREAEAKARREAEAKAAQEAAASGASPSRSFSYTIREVDGYTELEYLAAICFLEASNQYEGSLAVANVILNRVQSSRFPDTIYDVIFQKNQFAVRQIYRILAAGPYSNCLKAAEDALAGYNNVGSRFFFNATWSVSDARKSQLGDYVIIGGNCFF